jgi:hypothetical protein
VLQQDFVSKTNKKYLAGLFMPTIPATLETELMRIKIQGPPGQKVSEIPFFSTNKPGMWCICHFSYMKGINMRTLIMLITNLPLKQKNQSPETILFYKVSTIH